MFEISNFPDEILSSITFEEANKKSQKLKEKEKEAETVRPVKIFPDSVNDVYDVIKNDGDGNCQFSSFAFLDLNARGLDSSPSAVRIHEKIVRAQIVNFLRNHRKIMLVFPGTEQEIPMEIKPGVGPLMGPIPVDEYLDVMGQDKIWGDDFTLWAYATLRNVTIIIINKRFSTPWGYEGDLTQSRNTTPWKHVPNAKINERIDPIGGKVYLLYSGVHYEALKVYNSDALDKIIAPANDVDLSQVNSKISPLEGTSWDLTDEEEDYEEDTDDENDDDGTFSLSDESNLNLSGREELTKDRNAEDFSLGDMNWIDLDVKWEDISDTASRISPSSREFGLTHSELNKATDWDWESVDSVEEDEEEDF